ncbi:MAG: hypothetical protein WAM69_03270 [Candidatus Sulfotelmatobacter sp.]
MASPTTASRACPECSEFTTESVDGKVKVGGNLDAGEPRAGRIRQVSIILPEGMDGEQTVLRAELEVKGMRRPVRWAVGSRRTLTAHSRFF